MKRIFRATVLLLIFSTVLLSVPAPGLSQWPPICQESSLPSHDHSYPADQLIVICVPPNWNGGLVLYAHGYIAPQSPLALPVNELTVGGTFVPNILLSQGFAFATSSFHKNGVAIEQGADDLLDLLRAFKSIVPRNSLKKVYIVGGSEGGLIALDLLENRRGEFDAGLALCTPLGGSAAFIKRVYDFRVVFDYFFDEVFTFPPNTPGEQSFGAFDVPADAYKFWDVYMQRIIAALSADPLSAAQLFSVTKAVIDPTHPTTSAAETALLLLSYNIFGANDLIATAGGIPYDNRSTSYSGSANDAALNAGVERVEADGRARAYAQRFYDPKGNLHDPLVTLHTLLDPLAPFREEIHYATSVVKKKKLAFLNILPVAGYGHCEFTTQDVIQAFGLMVQKAGG